MEFPRWSYRRRMASEVWALGAAYDAYMGRWSRLVAQRFVPWLRVPAGGRWLDVGCGTGVLSESVMALADPVEIVGVDKSEGFLDTARAQRPGLRSSFVAADAQALPFSGRRFDAVVSGLALNFVPDPGRALDELTRVAAWDGVVAAYVWDYAEGMAMIRRFWDAAAALDPAAVALDEARRFPLCRPESLAALWRGAGLNQVTTRAIEIPTVFADFDDFWAPYLGGQGPAPGYVSSLSDEDRDALQGQLRQQLPAADDGTIRLTARAWAVQGSIQERP